MQTTFTAIDFETAQAKRWSICQVCYNYWKRYKKIFLINRGTFLRNGAIFLGDKKTFLRDKKTLLHNEATFLRDKKILF